MIVLIYTHACVPAAWVGPGDSAQGARVAAGALLIIIVFAAFNYAARNVIYVSDLSSFFSQFFENLSFPKIII